MTQPTISLFGRVARGHRVASGLSGDPRFPNGTIAPQLPYFRAAIADFDSWLGARAWPATVNIAMPGTAVLPGVPDAVVGPVAWTTHFPPERFLMSRCVLVHRHIDHAAWLYMPDPATKPEHHQPANLIEILTQRVSGLDYDDPVELRISACPLVISVAAAEPVRSGC